MTGPEEHPAARWQRLARSLGADYADKYADRFEALAAEGGDVHGEADFVHRLTRPGSRVLDAGCGTGRVGLRLHDLGHEVVGVDADEAMVDVARRRSPGPRWEVADLATLDLGETFQVVVMAGNIVPFLLDDRLPAAVERLAAHLEDDGLLVCGYGLDDRNLPKGVPVVPLEDYDAACAAAGFELRERLSGWDGSAWAGGGYAVSLHRRTAAAGAAADPS